MSTIERALEIARAAHAGQVDKAGSDYISHPVRVSESVEGETAGIAALLHDVVEDCPYWTLDRLRSEGFSEAVVSAVDAVTRQPGEDYFDFVRRAAAHPVGRVVKIADIRDNLDRSRLRFVTPADENRFDRYAKALELLQGWSSKRS